MNSLRSKEEQLFKNNMAARYIIFRSYYNTGSVASSSFVGRHYSFHCTFGCDEQVGWCYFDFVPCFLSKVDSCSQNEDCWSSWSSHLIDSHCFFASSWSSSGCLKLEWTASAAVSRWKTDARNYDDLHPPTLAGSFSSKVMQDCK